MIPDGRDSEWPKLLSLVTDIYTEYVSIALLDLPIADCLSRTVEDGHSDSE